jgi:hypothetical protein
MNKGSYQFEQHLKESIGIRYRPIQRFVQKQKGH